MFVYNIWDVFILATIEAFFEMIPIFCGILLGSVGLIVLALWLHNIDNKYWHSKDWPWYKQLGIILLIIPILIFIGLLIIFLII